MTLIYNPSSPLNGALTYLQKYHKRIDINNGIVRISSSSIYSTYNISIPIVKRDLGEGAWCSNNTEGSWYEIDFLNNNFYLEGYFIRAMSNNYFLQWKVFGSNDKINYDVVDEVSAYTQPATYNNYFSCKFPKLRKTFKIVANGKRFANDGSYFCMRRIELYGKFNKNPQNCSCKTINRENKSFILWFIALCYS